MKKFLLFIAGSALFLSGCSNSESELNDFYDEFAASLSEEEGLGELNEQYNTLEGEKAALQEELNEASIEDINNISSELTENTEQRLELLQEESTLIESSNEVFDSARDAAENINKYLKKQILEKIKTKAA